MLNLKWEDLQYSSKCVRQYSQPLLSNFFLIPRNLLLWRRVTPCSRVLPEKLTGPQLVKKFPTFYGTRRFIRAFTSASHLPLSWARTIRSVPPQPTSWISILKLSSHLFLGVWPFPSGHPTKILCALPLYPPYVPHVPPISFFLIPSTKQYTKTFTCHKVEGHGDYSQYCQLPENIPRDILRVFFLRYLTFLCTYFTICRKTSHDIVRNPASDH